MIFFGDGRKHKKKNENDKEYKGISRTEMKRSRKKKSQKRGQKREGRSEVSDRRENRHHDHREVRKNRTKSCLSFN